MRLTKAAILAIRGSGQNLRKTLADEMNVEETSIPRWLNENEDNGKLTTLRALQIIEKETGLTIEQIIEEIPQLKVS